MSISETQKPNLTAKEFWGYFDEPGNKMSDILVMSLYDFCRACSSAVPQLDESNAKPYLSPHDFQTACRVLGVSDLGYSSADEEFLDYETVFDMHKKYYSLWTMQYDEIDDARTGVKMPLIPRKSLAVFVALRIYLFPDESHRAWNKALKEFKLLNPFDLEPFQHTTIPRSSFPKNGNDIVAGSDLIRSRMAENWPKAKREIMDAARKRGHSTRPGGSAYMDSAAQAAINAQREATINAANITAARSALSGTVQVGAATRKGNMAQLSALW